MVDTNKVRKAHFDEEELSEYDKTRGQCMKIDDPKTPWEDDEDQSADIEMTNEMEESDPIIDGHLEEARVNREKNCMLMANMLQKLE